MKFHPQFSINFKLDAVPPIFETAGVKDPSYILIWTTTPWTLPANTAVCLAPNADYVMVEVNDLHTIMAYELVEDVAKTAGWESYRIVSDAQVMLLRLKEKIFAV